MSNSYEGSSMDSLVPKPLRMGQSREYKAICSIDSRVV